MARSWSLAAALGLMLATAPLAMAQEDGPGGGRRFGGQGGFGGFGGPGGFGQDNGLGALMLDQVQKELELVDDQKEKLRQIGQELGTQMREQFAGLRELSPEDRRARMAEMREKGEALAKEMRQKIDAVLLPNQRDRLKQVQLQLRLRRGDLASAISEGDVATSLGLSEDQKTALREKQREARRDLEAKIEALRKESQDKLLEVLTSEQREKLKSMTGAPLELDSPGPRRNRQ